MPKLWTATVEAHHEAVYGAVLDAAASLVAARGLSGITMSAIASETGIGRATLYKYFSDVAAILTAWHERHIASHQARLMEIAHRPAAPAMRLRAVLEAYAQMAAHEQTAAAAAIHAAPHAQHARQHLRMFLGQIIAAAQTGAVRTDIAADELAAYCLAALDAAGAAKNNAAIGRLVDVTLDGLRPVRKSSRA